MIDSEEVQKESIRINTLRRKELKLSDDWDGFLKSEWKQLDRYQEVTMFGKPVKRLPGMVVLPWVWTY